MAIHATHPSHHELSEINHRQVLVNLINNAKFQAESDWGWRDDVGVIDRDEALTNLMLLYDNLLDKYDYLEAAYDVLAEIYNQSQLLADAQEDVEDIQDAQEDVHVQEVVHDAQVSQDAQAAHAAHAQSAQEAEAGPSKLQIPGGYTRSECGRIVKIQEIAPPQIPIQPRLQPRLQPPTQYPIPQPSTCKCHQHHKRHSTFCSLKITNGFCRRHFCRGWRRG